MINPISWILAFVRALTTLLLMFIFLLVYIPLSYLFLKNTPKNAFRLRRLYVYITSAIFGISCEVEGTPHKGTALYVSNHRNFLDPLIFSHYVNAYVIAKAEVSKIPLLDTGAKLTGIIYVQRENKGSRSSVRQKMVETLLQDINILVYPEGTVNVKQELLEYRPGTFIETAKINIPVVPVVLEYHNEKDLWENKSLFSQFFQSLGKLRTKTKLSIGPAMNDDDGLALRDKVQKWSQAKVNEMHVEWKNSVFSKKK